VQVREPEPVNILTALAENQSVVKNQNDPERKAIALAWLFHLVGDSYTSLCTRRSYSRLSIPRTGQNIGSLFIHYSAQWSWRPRTVQRF
jgi:hypothetical protein